MRMAATRYRYCFIGGLFLRTYYLLWSFFALVFLSVFMLGPFITEVMQILFVRNAGTIVVY